MTMLWQWRGSMVLALLIAQAAAQSPGEFDAGKAAELATIWNDLAQTDEAATKRAYRHIQHLIQYPQETVAFLRDRLKPAVAGPHDQHIKGWIGNLDSRDFACREKAARELEKLGPLIEPWLEDKLQERPSLELRMRLERLLERLGGAELTPEDLRASRAMEALVGIGTRDARTVLEILAKGAPGARLTRQAKAAIQRLAN